MNEPNYMTAHELAKELLKMPEDTVVCFDNGKGVFESVKTIKFQKILSMKIIGIEDLPPEIQEAKLRELKEATPQHAYLNSN